MIPRPDIKPGAAPDVLDTFVRAVAKAADTPAVIRLVAVNTAYLDLCRRIAAMDETAAPPRLEEACRRTKISLPHLRDRLLPVARALRLLPETTALEYYQVLGVPEDCDAAGIRNAYRRRARELHPDLKPGRQTDATAFAALTAAYETLRDPAAREAYDRSRVQTNGAWFEPPPRRLPAPPRRRFTAVIVVVSILVAAALLLDQIDRESTRPYTYAQARHAAVRPAGKPPPEITPAVAPAPSDDANDPLPPYVKADAAMEAAVPPDADALPIVHASPPAPVASAPRTKSLPAREAQVPIDAATVRRLVIFHDAAGARLAAALKTFLEARNYPPADLARSPEASARPTNIRYFSRSDHRSASALHACLQDFLAREENGPDRPVRLVNLSRRYPGTAAGLLEVWLNSGRPAEAPPPARVLPSEQPDVRPAAPSEAATRERVRAFLATYCRTYESRDPDRLAALFATDARENGTPLVELLPRYRSNMAKILRLSYRIDMENAAPRYSAGGLRVEGRFAAHAESYDHRDYRSQGTIVMHIVPHADTYRIARLDYEIE